MSGDCRYVIELKICHDTGGISLYRRYVMILEVCHDIVGLKILRVRQDIEGVSRY